MSKLWKLVIIVEILTAATIWLAVVSIHKELHVIACNVGQGDAILLVYQNTEVLIDGGPNRSVLDCLGKHLPLGDRTLELVVLTHPEKDHYGGLVEVFKKYQVKMVMLNDLEVISPDYQVLVSQVGGSGARVVHPVKGTRIGIGLISLDVEAPDAGPKKAVNEYSIVLEARFGNFLALLLGDSQYFDFGANHHVQYIKVPHHGSKNGLSASLLKETTPQIAVISVGKNSYGHPTDEILQMLAEQKAQVLRTDQMGDIDVATNGTTWKVN